MSRGEWREDQFLALPSLSVAAHELKSPIALMRQLSLLLEDNEISSEQRADFQNQLVVISDRALKLTTDLTQAANLQPELFPLEPVNPFAICRKLAYETKPLAKLYNRQINWPKSRRSLLAVANSQLLTRILANFIDNAMKYTEPDIPIAVQIRQSTDKVRLAVRDFGPRLTKREYQQMVDEMEQLKKTRTRPESSGLGIFLAAKFAESMHGKIGLVRHRDGVTFFVELPLSRQMSML